MARATAAHTKNKLHHKNGWEWVYDTSKKNTKKNRHRNTPHFMTTANRVNKRIKIIK